MAPLLKFTEHLFSSVYRGKVYKKSSTLAILYADGKCVTATTLSVVNERLELSLLSCFISFVDINIHVENQYVISNFSIAEFLVKIPNTIL